MNKPTLTLAIAITGCLLGAGALLGQLNPPKLHHELPIPIWPPNKPQPTGEYYLSDNIKCAWTVTHNYSLGYKKVYIQCWDIKQGKVLARATKNTPVFDLITTEDLP